MSGARISNQSVLLGIMPAKGASLADIQALVGKIKFGSVLITIRNEQIIEIETRIKRKLDAD